MLWRILKPDLGAADKPSVRRLLQSARFSIIVVALLVALWSWPSAAACGPSSSGTPNHDDTEISARSLLTNSPPPVLGTGSLAGARYVVPGYTIHRVVPEVRIEFSVTDEQRRLVESLSATDLRLFDDQQAVKRFRNFSRMNDLPLQIGILLDVSDSVEKTVSREKLATQLFVRQVLRPQTDRAFLLAFGQEVQLWQASTGDLHALEATVDRIHQLGHATNLYDGLFYACLNQFPRSAENETVQRIIVLFSDGNDTGSLHALGDTIALAQRREIQIYALAVHPQGRYSQGDAVLRRLAEETGGQFYVAASERDFAAVFAAMDEQMRTQYYVSFRPERETPGFHELRLEMTSPGKLRIHARQGYYYDAP
jgi:VWFA-related protein